MDGNEVDLVHVSFSYKLHIPFMLYIYKILHLGSTYCLKVLKGTKSKIITIILTTTTLFISTEKNAKGIGTFGNYN